MAQKQLSDRRLTVQNKENTQEVCMKYAAAIDLGGTNTRVALINENFEIEARVQFATDAEDPEPVLARIVQEIKGFQKEIIGVGMSCPGPLDLLHGNILTPPNLHGRWHHLAITDELEKRLGIPVHLENDANLAALAEASAGAGRGCGIVQYLTISTGFGAGLAINGTIFQGAHGFANEVFNTCMVHNGPRHGSIIPGGIEAICSGTAIEQRAEKAGLCVSHAGDVFALAKAGNPQAETIITEAKLYLAYYIAGIIGYTDPDIVILGGSVALKTEGFVREIEDMVKTMVTDIMVPYVHVVPASFAEDAGLIGAASLVFGQP